MNLPKYKKKDYSQINKKNIFFKTKLNCPQNVTGFALTMTGIVLIKTGFALNKSGFHLKIKD